MSYFIPRFLRFDGYKTIDIQTSTKDRTVKIILEPEDDKCFNCHICHTPFKHKVHSKIRKVKDLDIRGFKTTIIFSRRTGECLTCNKQRVEEVEFISPLSPHYTKEYAWWLGEMCEMAPVKKAAKFCGIDNMTLRRIDYSRMLHMVQSYKIPEASFISVDEVYARKKSKEWGESRNKKFFTVISDLETRKVIWVSQSRDKAGLDQFYRIIGPKSCAKIRAVAMDQHEPYRSSTIEHCPNACVLWDRFHLMQSFNEVANELRKDVFSYATKEHPIKRLTQGKFRYIFLKKDSRRTSSEKQHLEDVMDQNWYLSRLEVIKERFYQFFQKPKDEAWKIFDEIGDWVQELEYPPLIRWWENLEKSWDTLKNYFDFRVTSALSEGINNVIKSVKRQAFGFRNMEYFQLKIMQRCGYLNSEFINTPL